MNVTPQMWAAYREAVTDPHADDEYNAILDSYDGSPE